MDTATKTGMDVAKAAGKRVVQKTAEGTGDLIGKPKEKKQKKYIFRQKKDNKLLMA